MTAGRAWCCDFRHRKLSGQLPSILRHLVDRFEHHMTKERTNKNTMAFNSSKAFSFSQLSDWERNPDNSLWTHSLAQAKTSILGVADPPGLQMIHLSSEVFHLFLKFIVVSLQTSHLVRLLIHLQLRQIQFTLRVHPFSQISICVTENTFIPEGLVKQHRAYTRPTLCL